jgi:uncharacterized membrane protein HdeD (DUF308 family)
MLTEERMIVREGARYWWLFLISGILWLLIAWMVLRLNATSIATVGVLLGVVFLIAAINEVGVAALAPGGWKVWHYLLAAIFFLGGLYGFVRPVNTFFALASVLGLVLVFYGAFEIVQGVASRAVNPYWWVSLVIGILLVLLAFWVSESDRMFALGPADLSDLVLGGVLGVVPGLLPDLFGLHRPPRRTRGRRPLSLQPGPQQRVTGARPTAWRWRRVASASTNGSAATHLPGAGRRHSSSVGAGPLVEPLVVRTSRAHPGPGCQGSQ